MSLIEFQLRNRPRFFGTPTAARRATVRPAVEILEERDCPSVVAPTGLTLTAISSTQVKLTWTNPAGSLGTNIYTWNGTSSSIIGNVGKGVTTFTVSNLTPNQTQWFSISAFDATTTAQSAWMSVTTPAMAITAPTNVHEVSSTQTSITLAWTNGADATGYRVYEWNGSSGVLVGSTTPAAPALTVNGLTAGVTYYFYVQAYNADNSVSTSWVTASTTGEGLATPTGLKASANGAGTIALSWGNAAGATGYRVYQWSGNSLSSPVMIATLPANTTAYQATGLSPGATYWFYVQAYTATSTTNTGWVSAATSAAAALQAPTHVTAQPDGSSTATVSWTGSAAAAGYEIYKWEGTWVPVANVSAGTTEYNVTGLSDMQSNWLMVESYTAGYAQTAYSSAVFVNL